MNHLQAQSLIIPYCEDRLPADRQEDFVIHMKNCPECHKELEIYYTLIKGIKEIDENRPLTQDFADDLEESLDRMKGRARGRKSILISSVTLLTAALLFVTGIFYIRTLNKVYYIEQDYKAKAQEAYYFGYHFGPVISHEFSRSDRDINEAVSKLEAEKAYTFYDSIHETNRLNEICGRQLEIGEGLTNGGKTIIN